MGIGSLFESKSKTESKVKPYDESQLQDILSRLQTLGGTPQTMFPDQMYAGMDPLQTEALGMREDFARNMGGMVDPSMQAWQSTLGAPDVANNPYVQGMINQQATTLNRNLAEMMPTIESNMLGVNERLGGSGEGVAKGIAGRGTQEALADAMARTQLGAYGQGLQQQQFGLKAAPAMAGFGMMPADVISGVGGVQRAEDQMGINEAVQRYNFEQQEPWQRLQNQAGMFQGLTLPYASAESKTTSTPSPFSSALNALTGGFSGAMGAFGGGGAPGGGGMMSGGGGMMSGGGMGGGGMDGGSYGSALSGGGGATPASFLPMASMFAMSDRRLKSNIKRIGQTPSGQPVYSYTIDGRNEVGVMADESPAEAVHRHSSGYLMVDYAQIK